MSTATLTRPPPTYVPQKAVRSSFRQSLQLQQQQEDGGSSSSNIGNFTRTGARRRKSALRTIKMVRKSPPPLIQKVGLAAQVYGIQGFMGTMTWFQDWRDWFWPAGGGPNIVKAYETRPGMPVRIFFPASYDLTSPQELPTVLSIHGGGFCIGTSKDDDKWNRRFADSQNMLVISLPYQKAPRAPFPAGLQDLEALYLAVLGDESLPIDRTSRSNSIRTSSGRPARGRVALLGFDAGGNLALGLGQLAGVRHAPTPPTAAVSICGYLDLERAAADKSEQNRPYKPALSRPRNGGVDPLAATYPAYVWSYVPYGHDLRDPLLSPAFAGWDDGQANNNNNNNTTGGGGGGGDGALVITTNGGRGGLLPHVCLVGAELDMLAHESWRLACRLVRDGGIARGDGRTGRWCVPDPDAAAQGNEGGGGDDEEPPPQQRICGRRDPAPAKGRLEVSEEDVRTSADRPEDGVDASKRFGFEVRWKGTLSAGGGGGGGEQDVTGEEGSGSVKWILVPDVMHGFDRDWWVPPGGGGPALEETVRDAQLKTVAYVDAVGGWLRGTVWEM